jgi:cell wall-associated NlpC family hydrolase
MTPDIMLAAHALIAHLPLEEQQQRLDVVQEAMTWLHTPYHHAARIKGAGVDCGMFLAEVYEQTGVMPHVVPDEYPPDWHMHQDGERYLGLVAAHAHQVEVGLPGDIVLYRFGRCVSHGAIVIVWPQIIHAYIRLGVVLDEGERNTVLREAQVGFWSPWGGI